MSYIQCCPACQSTMQVPMFDMGDQPLSLVQLKQDPDRSEALQRYAIYLYICQNCGHVHNIYFNPNFVSYSQEGCRMWNNGKGWQEHMDSVRSLCESFEDLDYILEIGAGDCSFLASLHTTAKRLAIDPCEAVENDYGIDYVRDYFDHGSHMKESQGNQLIVMRHLLEHMENPRVFLEPIVHAARARSKKTYLYIETPNCLNALRRARIEDWTYEHPQHFTINSMHALFANCGIEKSMVRAGYGGEVVMAVAEIEPEQKRGITVEEICDKYQMTELNICKAGGWIKENLDDIALWGGAGKSAMFINKFGFPPDTCVVDSDSHKLGYCVPGTRIKMRVPTEIVKYPPKYIIATTSWRANDIKAEIKKHGIACEKLFKFENGELTEVPLG